MWQKLCYGYLTSSRTQFIEKVTRQANFPFSFSLKRKWF